jgi:hypothetical protein
LLWLTHYRSTLKCPSSITQWRLFSSSVVHVGNVVHKGSWKCGNVLVISNHMFIRKECYITDGILHFAQSGNTNLQIPNISLQEKVYEFKYWKNQEHLSTNILLQWSPLLHT